MDFMSTFALTLIENIYFIAAALAVVMAVRALVRGEVRAGSTRFPTRTIYRQANPIQFWLELGLYAVVIIFLLMMGLFMHGLAPAWFVDILQQHRPR